MEKGRKLETNVETERSLDACIEVLRQKALALYNMIFWTNNLTTVFKDGKPGRDWLLRFLKRNKLSTKKANMLSKACHSATANPFIVYDFYENLDRVVTEKNLSTD